MRKWRGTGRSRKLTNRKWLVQSGLRSGTLFRGIHNNGRLNDGISGRTINRIVKRRIKLIGLDPDQFGAHSLRSGFITEAARSGATLGDAMTLSGHRCVEVANGYYRKAAVMENPAGKLLFDEFDQVVKQISRLAKADVIVNPEDFYPPQKPKGGKTRELPIEDNGLRKALSDYIDLRLLNNPQLKPHDPLILSQKGVPYSPNTLQDHMSMMMRKWAHIDRASSHSGRRTLASRIKSVCGFVFDCDFSSPKERGQRA